MPRLPRVVHVVIALRHGGLEQLVVRWTNARNARQAGSTMVCCLDETGDLASELEGDGPLELHARRSRFPWDRSAVKRLRAYLSTGGASGHTILHSHNIAAQQYAALAARGTPNRHIHTEHGSNIYTKGMLGRLRARWLGRVTDRITAVSRDTATKMMPCWGLGSDAVSIIANGVTPHPEYPDKVIDELRREVGIPGDAFTIGSIGRIAPEKGYDRLLEVLSSAMPGRSSWSCLLIGDGPERFALEAQAESLGIADRLITVGFQREARRYYDLIDLFVLPSWSEGLSISLLEAMAARCPVLVTDVGENRSAIDDAACGWLLPEAQSQWGQTISRCVSDVASGSAAAMGDAAKRRVAEHYSQDASVQMYEALYASMSPV